MPLEGRGTSSTTKKPEGRAESSWRGSCRSVSSFRKLGKLGEGTYGTVYRAKVLQGEDKGGAYGPGHQTVALKRVLLHNEQADGFPLTSLREVALLRRVRGHPHCVELLDVVVGRQRDSVFLVFEYCEHDLARLLAQREGPCFSRSEVKRLMLQLLSAVAHLHDHWIIHRDLKMSNLLYNGRGQLKLADFGLARTYGYPLEALTPTVVTLWYRAPELLLGCERYTTAVDMWATGCIMAELERGGSPILPGTSEVDQVDRICRLLGSPTEIIWPGLTELPSRGLALINPHHRYSNLASLFEQADPTSSSEGSGRGLLLALLGGLLTYDPGKRLTADEALHHGYFRESPRPKEERYMPTFPIVPEEPEREEAQQQPQHQKETNGMGYRGNGARKKGRWYRH